MWRSDTANQRLSHPPSLTAAPLLRQVELNPAVVPVYTESLRLCGNWLAETCLESPGVILENYLERVRTSGGPDSLSLSLNVSGQIVGHMTTCC